METNNSINLMNKKMPQTKKIAISGVVMALYIVIMYTTQSFAFGQYQVRIATALYSLSAIYPFLILPLGLSNMLSNMLIGGLGFFDVAGGIAVGIITASMVYLIRRLKLKDWFIALPIVFGPGLIVPIWLSYILKLPYSALAVSLCIGQIVPGIAGVILVRQLNNKL